jgi:hypothetical protein
MGAVLSAGMRPGQVWKTAVNAPNAARFNRLQEKTISIESMRSLLTKARYKSAGF